jgi:hypothetical protein
MDVPLKIKNVNPKKDTGNVMDIMATKSSIWGFTLEAFLNGYPIRFAYKEKQLEITLGIPSIGWDFCHTDATLKDKQRHIERILSSYLHHEVTLEENDKAEIIRDYMMWCKARYLDKMLTARLIIDGNELIVSLKSLFGGAPSFVEIERYGKAKQ